MPVEPISRLLRGRRFVLGLVGVTAVVLAGIAIVAVGRGPVLLDLAWQRVVSGRSAPLDTLALVLSFLGGTLGATIATTVIAAILLWMRRWAAAITVALSVGAAAGVETLLKLAFQRPRPIGGELNLSTFSYPSGHLTATTAAAVALAIAVRSIWPRVAGAAMVLAMVWDRTYLGVHWLSDTIAGAVLGASVAALVSVAVEAAARRTGAQRDGQLHGGSSSVP